MLRISALFISQVKITTNSNSHMHEQYTKGIKMSLCYLTNGAVKRWPATV